MIRIIVEYDKDDEEPTAYIFGRFLFSCTQIDGTGWTEFEEYLKELFVRRNADYSPLKIITKDAQNEYRTKSHDPRLQVGSINDGCMK